MRTKLPRCHLVVPAPGAESSSWPGALRASPAGWSACGSARLGCAEAHGVPGPFPGAGATWKPLPLGLHVPCCGIGARSAAGQRGRQMMTATSQPCSPRTAGFVSLIPVAGFSSLLAPEGGILGGGLGLAAGSTFRSGRATGVPAGCPRPAALCFWVQWVRLTRGRGPHLGSAQERLRVRMRLLEGPCVPASANSPAEARRAPARGAALGRGVPAAADSAG